MNEDTLVVNEKDGVYGVVDGATSLSDYRDDCGRTGGYIAAHLLASHLQNVPEDTSLTDVVMRANKELRQKMAEAGVDVADKTQLWSAAFAVFRVGDTYVEYVQAGDCMLFAKYRDGTYRQITIDQVAHADRLALQKRREAIARGIREPEKIREYVYPTIRENRTKANTPEGYAVMNGEIDLRDHLEAGRISRARLSRLYAVTDGLFHCLEGEEPCVVWSRMLSDIDRYGLEAYAANLLRMERDDPDCTKMPRLKISDDKTGIVLDL